MLGAVLVNREIGMLIGYGVAVAAVGVALAIKYLPPSGQERTPGTSKSDRSLTIGCRPVR